MKRTKFTRLTALLLLILTLLSSCGEYNPATGGHPSGSGTGSGSQGSGSSGAGSGTGSSGEESPFTVTLVYGGQTYIPAETIEARWNDGFSYHTATVGSDGKASIEGLDGDYQVTLSAAPTGYAYDPNAYVATNDNRNIEIELKKLVSYKDKKTQLYNCIPIKSTGLYRVELDSAKHEVFFEFAPTRSGMYSITSWVDTTENTVNPKANYYGANFAFKQLQSVADDGAAASTYTKNFKLDVDIADEMISTGGQVRFTFGIMAEEKNAEYPAEVYFAITLDGEFPINREEAEIIIPEEELRHQLGYSDEYSFYYPERAEGTATVFDGSMYSYWERDALGIPLVRDGVGATPADKLSGSYALSFYNAKTDITFTPDAVGSTRGTVTVDHYIPGSLRQDIEYSVYSYELVGEKVVTEYLSGDVIPYFALAFDGDGSLFYGKGDGYYHLYDKTTGVYGPILYANISSPTRFLGEGGNTPLTSIEEAGNKALTVSNGTENYKLFIQGLPALLIDPGLNNPTATTGAYFCDRRCPCRNAYNEPTDIPTCIGVCGESCENCHADCRNLPDEAMALFEAAERGEIPATDVDGILVPNVMLGYSAFCNSDGNYAVTAELQDFLQKLSESQRYFMDGNGWIESQKSIYSEHADQWLFGVGFYAKVAYFR